MSNQPIRRQGSAFLPTSVEIPVYVIDDRTTLLTPNGRDIVDSNRVVHGERRWVYPDDNGRIDLGPEPEPGWFHIGRAVATDEVLVWRPLPARPKIMPHTVKALAGLIDAAAASLWRVQSYMEDRAIPGDWTTPETGFPFAMSLEDQVAALFGWSARTAVRGLLDAELLHRFYEQPDVGDDNVTGEMSHRWGEAAVDLLAEYFTASHASESDRLWWAGNHPALLVEIATGTHVCGQSPQGTVQDGRCRCGVFMEQLAEIANRPDVAS